MAKLDRTAEFRKHFEATAASTDNLLRGAKSESFQRSFVISNPCAHIAEKLSEVQPKNGEGFSRSQLRAAVEDAFPNSTHGRRKVILLALQHVNKQAVEKTDLALAA